MMDNKYRTYIMDEFIAPDNNAKLNALPSVEHLPAIVKTELWEKIFRPIAMPGPDDWLNDDAGIPDRKGETFSEFTKYGKWPSDKKKKVIIEFLNKKDNNALHDVILEYCRIFFCGLIDFEIKTQSIDEIGLDMSEAPEDGYGAQVDTEYINSYLNDKYVKGHDDIFAAIALVSDFDLVCEEEWVFGVAADEYPTAVFSFIRYVTSDNGLFVKRTLSLIAHELLHIFGLGHCIYFSCMENGSNTLEEGDLQPAVLCDICLCKLHYCLTKISPYVNLIERENNLIEFYKKTDSKAFENEINFHNERLKYNQ